VKINNGIKEIEPELTPRFTWKPERENHEEGERISLKFRENYNGNHSNLTR